MFNTPAGAAIAADAAPTVGNDLNCVLLYAFDNAGNPADKSLGGQIRINGTLQNGAAIGGAISQAAFGNALQLPQLTAGQSNADRVQIPEDDDIKFPAGGPWAIDFWVYLEPGSASSTMWDNGYTSNPNLLIQSGSTDPAQINVFFLGTMLASTLDCPRGEWCHVGIKQVADVLSIWINGQAAGSRSETGAFSINADNFFGGNSYGGGANLGVEGAMDELRVSNVGRDFTTVPPTPYEHFVFQDEFSRPSFTNLGTFQGLTVVSRFPTVSAMEKVRLTISAGSGSDNFRSDEMWLGIAKASGGNPYDFDGPPVSVTHSRGTTSFSLSTGASQVTDELPLSVPAGRDLVLSSFVATGVGNMNIGVDATFVGSQSWWISGNEAAQQDKSAGYAGGQQGGAMCRVAEHMVAET